MTAAQQSAETLLRTNGGRTVLLRMPAPATPGDESEVLGFATPTFNDVPLGPAVFRKASSTSTLLLSANAVEKAVGVLDFDSADVLFETAAGVVVDDVLYRVSAIVPYQAFGAAYCYAVSLNQ